MGLVVITGETTVVSRSLLGPKGGHGPSLLTTPGKEITSLRCFTVVFTFQTYCRVQSCVLWFVQVQSYFLVVFYMFLGLFRVELIFFFICCCVYLQSVTYYEFHLILV